MSKSDKNWCVPPPYEEAKENKAQWSEEQVAAELLKLGASSVWKRYGELCIEHNYDGATMMDASLDDLLKYGFQPQHARLVIKHFQAPVRIHQQQQRQNLQFTVQDTEAMQAVLKIYDDCKGVTAGYTKAIEDLKTRREEEQKKLNDYVEELIQYLQEQQAITSAELDCQSAELIAELHENFQRVQDTLALAQTTEQECLELQAFSISELKERTQKISELMKVLQALPTIVPLATNPAISILYNSENFSEKAPPFKVSVTKPSFQQELQWTSAAGIILEGKTLTSISDGHRAAWAPLPSEISRFRFCVQPAQWLMIGVSGQQKATYSTPLTYGWACSNQTWSNGTNHVTEWIGFQTGDVIDVCYDCRLLTLTMSVQRLPQKSFTITTAPGIKYLYANFYHKNTSLIQID